MSYNLFDATLFNRLFVHFVAFNALIFINHSQKS